MSAYQKLTLFPCGALYLSHMCLLQAYRTACHISDSEESLQDNFRIASNTVMDKLVLFMLTEASLLLLMNSLCMLCLTGTGCGCHVLKCHDHEHYPHAIGLALTIKLMNLSYLLLADLLHMSRLQLHFHCDWGHESILTQLS